MWTWSGSWPTVADPAGTRPRALGRIALGTAALGWLAWVGVHLARAPWLFDDRILLVNGHFAPLAEALHLAWTGDYWRLAAEGQQVLAGMYRPVLATSFALEQAVVGVDPAVAHAINGLLHLIAVVLTGVWARQRGGSAALAGVLVAVHPFAAELLGVATNRGDLLATVCVVGSLVARRAGRLVLAGVLVGLGVLTKEVAWVAPLLWWVDGERPGRRWLAAWVPVVLVAGLRGVFLAPPPLAVASPVPPLVATGHAALALVAPIPGGPLPAAPPAWVAGPLLLAGLVLARTAPFLPAWLLLSVAPMAGWAGLPTRPADGTLYLPLTGVAVSLAGAGPAVRRGAWAAAVGVLLPLQLLALHLHRDPAAFWAWATRAHADAALGWSNLAASVAPTDPARAATAYDEATRLARATGDVTELARALQGRGWVALLGGDARTARRCFEEAIARVGAERAPLAVKGMAVLRTGGGG